MQTWAIVIAALTPVLTILAVVYGQGRMEGKIIGRIQGQEDATVRHERWLAQHDDKFEHHDSRFNSLEVQAATSKAWREGFQAASQSDGKR